jgi:hypothetical protein
MSEIMFARVALIVKVFGVSACISLAGTFVREQISDSMFMLVSGGGPDGKSPVETHFHGV